MYFIREDNKTSEVMQGLSRVCEQKLLLTLLPLRAFFGGKINEPFRLESISLISEFLFDNFSKNFLLLCVKFDAFLRLNGSLIFPLKEGAQKRKC